MPTRSGETVAVAHSVAPPGIDTRNVALSLGGITCSPYAVVQPALDPIPCVTPSRKETVWPGPTIS